MLVSCLLRFFVFFFFNDTATTEIYTLSLHDALPILPALAAAHGQPRRSSGPDHVLARIDQAAAPRSDALRRFREVRSDLDRKSTRLNSSHSQISYAVFCLKKKKMPIHKPLRELSQHS